MKKILFFFIAIMCSCSFAAAQVCIISDTGDNVEVFSAIIEGGNTVVVTVGNDSQDNSANVTVTVEVAYKRNGSPRTYTFKGKGIAKPNQESVIRISIPMEDKDGYRPESVKISKIEGTKCK